MQLHFPDGCHGVVMVSVHQDVQPSEGVTLSMSVETSDQPFPDNLRPASLRRFMVRANRRQRTGHGGRRVSKNARRERRRHAATIKDAAARLDLVYDHIARELDKPRVAEAVFPPLELSFGDGRSTPVVVAGVRRCGDGLSVRYETERNQP